MNVPVAFIIYKRPETTRRVFEAIRQARPTKLYLIADGPKTPDLTRACTETRRIVEEGIDWKCDFQKIIEKANLGCARRVQSGLDEVFKYEEKAIILEDDTLPDHSFFQFCNILLDKYEENNRVAHISGCNLQPEAFHTKYSYCFSSIINIWGWATWRRSWKNYDLLMKSWENENKKSLLKKWCINRNHRTGMRKMFDLHCNNNNPWSWDYQWNYSCWKNNGLSVIPKVNLVSNLGIGPDASNTKLKEKIPSFPELTSSINQIIHPHEISRDNLFDKLYFRLMSPSLSRKLKSLIKRLIN